MTSSLAIKPLAAKPPTTAIAAATLPLTPRYIVIPLLMVAIFTGFQGGRYYAGNILQEVGIFCSGFSLCIGAFFSVFHIKQSEWLRWVLCPIALAISIMCLWGGLYALRFGGNPLYNIMASREFLFILLCPAIYLNGRAGLSLKAIEKVIWVCLATLMVNYLVNYFTMDLRAAFFSPDHRISALITYDEWRGFRLKPPLFAIMIALLAASIQLVQRTTVSTKLLTLGIIAMVLTIWSIVMFRATLATMLLSILCYPLLLASPKRIALLILLLPLGAIAAPWLALIALDEFSTAEGGSIRLSSYQTALATIPHYFFFGTGEDSAFGQTYQSLFGPTFFPSDLGIIGTMFKYGLIGTALYLYFHFTILVQLVRTHWLIRSKNKPTNPLIWGGIIFFCAQTFNLILNPGLTYAQGITVACIFISFAALMQCELRKS